MNNHNHISLGQPAVSAELQMPRGDVRGNNIPPDSQAAPEEGTKWITLLAGLTHFLNGPEVLDQKSEVVGLFADIDKMSESEKDHLLGYSKILEEFGTHFARSVSHNTWDALKLLIVHRTKTYRKVGTFEAYAHDRGMSKQTAYHRIHLAETVLAIWESAPQLPIPEGVERLKAIHKLPPNHRVPFWSRFLSDGGGIEPGPSAVVKAVKLYAVEHGIELGGIPKSPDPDEGGTSVRGQGLEAFDTLIPAKLLRRFHGISPTRWTVEVLVSEMALPPHLHETAKQTADEIRQSNPDDWNALMDFMLAMLIRSVQGSLR